MMILLRDENQWREAVRSAVQDKEVGAVAPTEYPCLAGFLDLGTKLACCYVYPSSARQLLQAVAESPTGGSAAADHVINPTEEDWRRQMSAVIFAMISELIEIKALKPDLLEKAVHAKLARMDQWIADRDQSVLAGIPGAGQQLLTTMYPPRSDEESVEDGG